MHQSQEKQSQSITWSLLGAEGTTEEPHKTFQKVVKHLTKVKLETDKIFPVYDYFHTLLKATHYVFYAEITDMKKVRPSRGSAFSWFTFKQILKLPFNEQTRQDIIVAERVIKAQARNEAEKTQPLQQTL